MVYFRYSGPNCKKVPLTRGNLICYTAVGTDKVQVSKLLKGDSSFMEKKSKLFMGLQVAILMIAVALPVQAATAVTAAPAAPTASVTPSTNSTVPVVAASTADEQKMVDMINQERIAAGVNPLKVDARLASVGLAKANDMKTNNYFSHTSPTLGSPWDMMKQAGLPVGWAGENIGKTQSVESAMAGFMRSPGHKANIVDPRFTHVGIGIAGNLFVQEFLQIK